jgi:hypothetical protein
MPEHGILLPLAPFAVYEEKGGWGMMHLMESSGLRPRPILMDALPLAVLAADADAPCSMDSPPGREVAMTTATTTALRGCRSTTRCSRRGASTPPRVRIPEGCAIDRDGRMRTMRGTRPAAGTTGP